MKPLLTGGVLVGAAGAALVFGYGWPAAALMLFAVLASGIAVSVSVDRAIERDRVLLLGRIAAVERAAYSRGYVDGTARDAAQRARRLDRDL